MWARLEADAGLEGGSDKGGEEWSGERRGEERRGGGVERREERGEERGEERTSLEEVVRGASLNHTSSLLFQSISNGTFE